MSEIIVWFPCYCCISCLSHINKIVVSCLSAVNISSLIVFGTGMFWSVTLYIMLLHTRAVDVLHNLHLTNYCLSQVPDNLVNNRWDVTMSKRGFTILPKFPWMNDPTVTTLHFTCMKVSPHHMYQNCDTQLGHWPKFSDIYCTIKSLK